MNDQPLAPLLYRALEKQIDEADRDPLLRIDDLFRLLSKLFLVYTQSEQLRFTTLFSRIAYVGQRADLSPSLQYFIHGFRKEARRTLHRETTPDPQLIALGHKVVAATIESLWQTPPPQALLKKIPGSWPREFRPVQVQAFYPLLRVTLTGDEPAEKILLGQSPDRPGEVLRIRYDIADRNEPFNATIELIREVFDWPVTVHLIDVEVDEENTYRPKGFVLEPDYLVDVTAIAECFKDSGTMPVLHLTRKYLPFQTSIPLLLGNIANFLLDELMHDPEATFREVFRQVFRLNPLAFTLLPDRDLREIMQKAQKHFVNLKRVLQQDFPGQQIDPTYCFLEPTFYSDRYGIQGRLDVLSRSEEGTRIVELKSGKVFRPNIYGLNVNHFTQTLLYDLMVRATFGEDTDPQNYILYSGADDRNLRFAPVVKAQQLEALQLRNQLLGLEKRLTGIGPNKRLQWLEAGDALFDQVKPAQNPSARGFTARDLDSLSRVYGQMPTLEKKYFLAYSGFIAREHRLAKVGHEDLERHNGQAALWLNAPAEKDDQYELLAQLRLVKNNGQDAEPLLVFERTVRTNPLANFRKGDIAVLYPQGEEGAHPLSNQLFKCTIVDLSDGKVTVRLRSRQFNDTLFQLESIWCLEHDLLDSGFNDMYRSLFRFVQSDPDQRSLWLGNRPPAPAREGHIEMPEELTPEQRGIFQSIIRSEDYFLLWGPPGTGKTSIMLKHLVGYWYDQTDENLVLLAYTNRAVDEICDAICAYHPGMQQSFIRIGSRYSTAPEYQPRLLSTLSAGIDTRDALRALIRRHRIIVGTVSSVANKPELFQLKTFHRVLIDEASQILEPMLVGLLPHFRHVTLIGDHKQLPAVVVQEPEWSAVEDEDLLAIGLDNMRNSLFERLFKKCLRNAWHWGYAQLSHQGRMHRDLMMFPNQLFYGGKLKILPNIVSAHRQQVSELPVTTEAGTDPWLRVISTRRMVFLPTPADRSSLTRKTNMHEAKLIAELIHSFQLLYAPSGKNPSIGIITPYRAQIAQIRRVLEEEKMDAASITIDTVERYQGGARDVILISLCTNSTDQMRAMISLSEEGVDRKLNVALTRARQHLVILGNPGLLETNDVYRQLIAHCRDVD